MDITYTGDSIEGEPGPNIYWRGRPDEFLDLLLIAHELGVSNGVEINVGALPNVHLTGLSSYRMSSSENGHTLVSLSRGAMISNLDPKFWRGYLHNVLAISFSRGFVYQDLSTAPLVEEANIIMSSEGGG